MPLAITLAAGSHGSVDYVKMRHFHTLESARVYLKERGCTILGVEIMDSAQSIATSPYTGPTAFILGNEVRVSLVEVSSGLSRAYKRTNPRRDGPRSTTPSRAI